MSGQRISIVAIALLLGAIGIGWWSAIRTGVPPGEHLVELGGLSENWESAIGVQPGGTELILPVRLRAIGAWHEIVGISSTCGCVRSSLVPGAVIKAGVGLSLEVRVLVPTRGTAFEETVTVFSRDWSDPSKEYRTRIVVRGALREDSALVVAPQRLWFGGARGEQLESATLVRRFAIRRVDGRSFTPPGVTSSDTRVQVRRIRIDPVSRAPVDDALALFEVVINTTDFAPGEQFKGVLTFAWDEVEANQPLPPPVYVEFPFPDAIWESKP